MKIHIKPEIVVETASYTLTFSRERLLATYRVKNTDFYYGMSWLSAVDKVGQPDVTCGFKPARITKKEKAACEICVEGKSSLWKRKRHYYRCREESVEYFTVIEGAGAIDRCFFFRGNFEGRELGSLPGFTVVVGGCPNFLNKIYFHTSEQVKIGLDPDPDVWGPALSSGPLCFLLNNNFNSAWVSAGLAARPGENDFQSFEFNHKTESVRNTWDSVINTQSFSLLYYGRKKVSGRWESPHLVFHAHPGMDGALARYMRHLYDGGYLRKIVKKQYAWWKEPIFCGWHEQTARAMAGMRDNSKAELEAGPRTMDLATADNYENWLGVLRKNGIPIGTVIIDAKWQKDGTAFEADGKKWPDMRGFVERCHARGQRVLLWINAGATEGLCDKECIMKGDKPVACDPTGPAYQRRLKDGLHRMLSGDAGCYNADGLKIDGTNIQPAGYDLKNHGGIWGHELLRRHFEFIYTTAKKIKQDALISIFSANPYFENVCDMVRLGDLYTTDGDPIGTMEHRARMVKAAMPAMLIDTDGTYRFDVRDDPGDLMEKQVRLGIPTLYQAVCLARMRPFALPVEGKFQRRDYVHIANVINAGRKKTSV